MSTDPITPTTDEPDAGEIGRFVGLVDALWIFEATQRRIHGYGAFSADTLMPDSSFVKVLAWLKELASNG